MEKGKKKADKNKELLFLPGTPIVGLSDTGGYFYHQVQILLYLFRDCKVLNGRSARNEGKFIMKISGSLNLQTIFPCYSSF